MADKKKKGSAFEYDAIGKVVPEGYVLVKKDNGRIAYVPAAEAEKMKKAKKK